MVARIDNRNLGREGVVVVDGGDDGEDDDGNDDHNDDDFRRFNPWWPGIVRRQSIMVSEACDHGCSSLCRRQEAERQADKGNGEHTPTKPLPCDLHPPAQPTSQSF